MGRGTPGLLVLLLTAAVLPLHGQQDSVAPTVTWTRAGPGDTIVVPQGRTYFWVDRAELNRLRVRQRNDSIRDAARDSALADTRAAADSLRSALTGCRNRVSGLEIQVEAHETKYRAEREARKALQEIQPSGLEALFRGPSGFVLGTGVGLTGGVLACRGAN